jgi:alkylation response protein AidB-like acyl-CoA dehydrogenase
MFIVTDVRGMPYLLHLLQGMSGVSFGKNEKKLGWKAQPTCSISFEGVVVPGENLVGQEGQGFKIAMAACK